MRLWQQGMIALARNESLKRFMQSRTVLSELATRFVGGRDVVEVAETSLRLCSKGYRASLYYLGEYVENVSVIKRSVTELLTITSCATFSGRCRAMSEHFCVGS